MKHSAPGILSVFYFSDGTQKAAFHQVMRAETGGYMKVSTVRLHGVPLGQRQEGRVWEDLPESERRGCRKGQRTDRGEDGEHRRRCVVCPATCLSDPAGLRKPLLLC